VSKIQILLDHARNSKKLSSEVVTEWINGKTKDKGETPLHIAILTGNMEVINLLISNGADIHALNY